MNVLGIETSCDETSAAVVRDGKLRSNITRTQLFHSQFGGIVPELASRAHQRLIIPIVEEALRQAGIRKDELDAVAAVYGPGLIGSLLVGLSFGKSMALGLGLPFIGVDHMEAHVFSNLIDEPRPRFPFINVTVSGGHTQLLLVKRPFEYELLGQTKDDAVGEAFDKVAKMLGLGYPGGPRIDQLAWKGNPHSVEFPRPYLEDGSFEFSFSGLKTSVLYYLRKRGYKPAGNGETSQPDGFVADVCASFQAAVVDVLVRKVCWAAERFHIKEIAVAGGVAANSGLRQRLNELQRKQGYRVYIPKIEYCTDNGAMVAMVGYMRMKERLFSSLELAAEPNLSLEATTGSP